MANHSSTEAKAKNPVIVPIVEGQSEVISAPRLIRRILRETIDVWDVDAAKPFRVKRNLVVKKGELERAVKQAIRARHTERQAVGGVLVLLDADDDCPRDLAETLLRRAKSETRLPVSVVLPQMEFEAWFLACKEILRGVCGIRNDATSPEHPESIRGAKGQLSRNMVAGRRYMEVGDQVALVEKMDLQLCQERCRSFRKLIREIEYLVGEVRKL